MDAKWEDMTPEERNALVAEKVMGWERNTAWYTTGAPEELVGKVAWDGWQTGPAPHDITNLVDLPLFTTDIAAAWRVVEKMVDGKGWRLNYRPESGWTVENFCGVDSVPLDGWTWDDESVYATCATAPEAICLAALRAKGVGV